MSPLKLAWLNLKRNPLISWLLIFSMSLALGTVGLLYRIESLQSQRWERLAEWAPVIVGPKQGGLDLLISTGLLEIRNLDLIPYRLFETIRAKQDIQFEDKTKVSNEHIDLAVPLLMMAQADEHWLVGTDGSFNELLTQVRGESPLQDGIWFQAVKEIVLGSSAAQRFHKNIGDSMEFELRGPQGEKIPETVNLKVSGILKPTHTAWDEAALGDIHLGWTVYSKINISKVSIWGPEVLHYFWLKPGLGSLDALKSLINQRSIAQLAETSEEKARLESLLGQTRELSLLISGLILLICFVVISALMILRLQTQATQMAVLRALGFSNRKLFSWMFFEALFLLAGSFLAGLFWTQLFWWITSHLMKDSVTFLTSKWITPQFEWPVWLCGGLAFLISLVGPWIFVLKEDLHENLRV